MSSVPHTHLIQKSRSAVRETAPCGHAVYTASGRLIRSGLWRILLFARRLVLADGATPCPLFLMPGSALQHTRREHPGTNQRNR